jgi:hypothetical protein
LLNLVELTDEFGEDNGALKARIEEETCEKQ